MDNLIVIRHFRGIYFVGVEAMTLMPSRRELE